MTLNQLKEGLQKANRVFLELRLEARSRLTHSQYWTLMERLGERSKQVRSEETKRLQKKEKNLEKRNERCEKHVICRWMRDFCRKVIKDREEQSGRSDMDDTSDTSDMNKEISPRNITELTKEWTERDINYFVKLSEEIWDPP